MIDFRNCDCMAMMKEFPDKYFSLAIVDPPYGINHAEIAGKNSGTQYGVASAPKQTYSVKYWDKEVPTAEYFQQLFRVSKNCIVWGANYMTEFLPSSMGWIVWNKDNGTTKFSDCELAFSTFDRALRMFTYTWNGMLQGDMSNKEIRIHPAQKPVRLYTWLLANYAKQGDLILDTHVGSASSLIACHQLGFDVVGCELDKEYYDMASQRLSDAMLQQDLFRQEQI